MKPRTAVLLFLLLVPLFNLLTVLALPTLVNHIVLRRIVAQALRESAAPGSTPEIERRKAQLRERQGIDIALPAARADAGARTVVRPSPDLLYTACVFDLSRGPLHITAPVPESYLSVSGFAADSSNFFAINDRDASTGDDGRKKLDLVLSRDANTPLPAGARLIRAPGERGLILFRLLITDEAALPRLRAEFQTQQRCEPLQGDLVRP